MKIEEKATLAATAAAGITIMGVGIVGYIKTLKTEKAKRAQIELRKQEALACIANYRKRMAEVIGDTDVPLKDILRIMREENAFLDIVIDNAIRS